MFAGCGTPGSAIARLTHSALKPQANQQANQEVSLIRTDGVRKASSEILVHYGRTYRLSVPQSVRHQTIGVADTPKGVVLLLPPEWVASDHIQWTLAMANPNSASPDLLNRGARVLAHLQASGPGQSMNLVAITAGYALITESASPGANGSAVLWGVNLTTGRVRALHHWNPSRINGLPFVAGRGVVAWWDAGTGHGTALDLATGQSVQVPDVGSAEVLGWQNGTLWANGAPVHLPFLSPYPDTLPSGYRWLGRPAIIAVPAGWTMLPNVSGDQIAAGSPSDLRSKVVVSTSHCEGCYRAGVVSNRLNTVSGPDSPELQLPLGTLLFWLSDHAIAYTLPTTTPGYRTFGVTVTGPQGGMVVARVTVPIHDKKMATTILNSLRWP